MSAQVERYAAIVAGSGLAGMLTALLLRPAAVALIATAEPGDATASAWAQGGIAAAVGEGDSPAAHARDTVAAGAGLTDPLAAAALTADAPQIVALLEELGVRFDRDAHGKLALGREAAHSARRIVRAGGDGTGAEVVRALREAVAEAPWITVFANARVDDVLLCGTGASQRCDGAIVKTGDGDVLALRAGAVVLATGGLGGLYAFTTNPTQSRGAGLALAALAGARLRDLEFVQFHPTALDVAADPLPLLTEALRGEGARLVDASGERVMRGIDPALELAPRDVVARRVFELRSRGVRTYLDARALQDQFMSHFPTVFALCARHGIDPRMDPVPVVAAAHYHMGGVETDSAGRASVAGLYACGEVASTGVHGANRLASNSLLEAAAGARRVATAIANDCRRAPVRSASGTYALSRGGRGVALDDALAAAREAKPAPAGAWQELRSLVYSGAGVERDAARLRETIAALAARETAALAKNERDYARAALTASMLARAALARRETRGSHVRRDYPATAARARSQAFTLAELEGAPLRVRSA